VQDLDLDCVEVSDVEVETSRNNVREELNEPCKENSNDSLTKGKSNVSDREPTYIDYRETESNASKTEILNERPYLRRSSRVRKPSEKLVESYWKPSSLKESPVSVAASERADDATSAFIAIEPTESDLIEYSMLAAEENDDEPKSYKEALCRSDRNSWLNAMREEFKAHMECGTWTLVKKEEIPQEMVVIDSRWVFKIKIGNDNLKSHKARLVARGFADRNHYDRTEVYAPVSRLNDFRFFVSTANKHDLDLDQYDVRTAFLYGDLERPVFMKIPDGLELLGNDYKMYLDGNYVCELKRALYGLKVSPKRWFEKFKDTMQQVECYNYPLQPCLFMWRDKSNFLMLLLYVDDILICSNCLNKKLEVECILRKNFEIKSLGQPKKFLGIEIERDRKNKVTFIHQTSFIERIIKRFELEDAKVAKTPMPSNDALFPAE
jgi:hypothetical protein